MAFPTCTIRHEETGTSGRLDLEIEETDEASLGTVVRYAVLEPKVLRSFRSGGSTYSDQKNLDWIEDGVGQAASYRAERKALAAALCCFDMRKEMTGEKCFDHV